MTGWTWWKKFSRKMDDPDLRIIRRYTAMGRLKAVNEHFNELAGGLYLLAEKEIDFHLPSLPGLPGK
jgi:hypothetical protein